MRRKFTIKVFFLFFSFYILYSIFYISLAYAQEDIIGYAQINPASPLYFLKSAKEAIELKFANTTELRATRHFELANRRIREVRSLSNTPRQDLIQPTLEQYWLHIKEVKGLLSLGDETKAASLTNQLVAQMNVLQEAYDQVSDVTAKRSIRTAIYRVGDWQQDLINKLNAFNKFTQVDQITTSKLSACKFLAREASSSALNKVESQVWQERANQCFNQLKMPAL